MRHYIVYHNPDTMGYEHDTVKGFSIITSKSVRDAAGSTIWVIARRRESPRRYYLVQKFIAEQAEPADLNSDLSIVSASTGTQFKPEPVISDLPWFREFLKMMGNFGFGFQRLRDKRFIDALERVASAPRGVAPPRRRPGGVKPAPPEPDVDSKHDIHYAISIRQPYAEQILRGIKKFEYRSRPTRIIERVWIYAGAKPAAWPEDWEESGFRPEGLPAGVIVGSVEITDSKWDDKAQRFAYSLKNPRRLKSPLAVANQPQPVFWKPEFRKLK